METNSCRICLVQCTELDLDFKQFSKIYSRSTGFEIDDRDIPQKICSTCTSKLLSTSNFLNLCQKTEDQLTQIRTQLDIQLKEDFANQEDLEFEGFDEGEDEYIEEYLDEDLEEELIVETAEEVEPEISGEVEIVKQETLDPEVKLFQEPFPVPETFPLIDHSQSSFRREDYLNLPINQDDESYEEPILLTCDLCDKIKFKSLKRISELNYHVRNDHDESQALIRCDHCSRIFSAKCLFDLHIKENTCTNKTQLAIERYYCTFCYVQNIRPDSLRKHLKTNHPTQTRLTCSCNKRFNCLDELRLHHVKHQNCRKATAQLHKFLRCDFCSFTCCLESVMMHHCDKMHPSESRYPCACGKVLYCSRDLQLQSNLYRCTAKNPCRDLETENVYEKRTGRKPVITPETEHMTSEQRKRYKYKLKCQMEVQCPHCDFKTTAYNIKRHVQKIHQGVQYTCDICGTVFAQKASLKQHQEKKHLGINRSYVCQECKKEFCNWSTRYYHILRTHRKKLRHECRYCQKQFMHRADLEDHVAVKHVGEKRVSCDKCDDKFLTKKSLYWHQRSVHGTKPATLCSFCDKSFVSKAHAKRHETHHCRGKTDTSS